MMVHAHMNYRYGQRLKFKMLCGRSLKLKVRLLDCDYSPHQPDTAFAVAAQSIKHGDGFDPESQQGPLVSQAQLQVSAVVCLVHMAFPLF